MTLRHFLRFVLVPCLLVAACGGDSSNVEPEATIPTTTTTTTTTIAATTSTTTTTTQAPTTTTTLAPPVVITTTDLIYAIGEGRNGPVEWKADFHRPAEAGDWPTLVFIPGQTQGKNSAYRLAEELAAHGVAVLAIDYADRAPTAMPNDDAKGYREVAALLGCANRFARRSVADAGGDLQMVAVGGWSLGGGVAAHAALAGEFLDPLWEEFSASRGLPSLADCVVEEGSTHVDALFAVAGAYDNFTGYESLYGLEYLQERDMQVWELLHGALELNPALQVRLLHGTTDTLIPYGNSEDFVAALAEVGIDAELTEFEGGHSFPHDEAVAAILEFLGVADTDGS